jgi:MFS family permease
MFLEKFHINLKDFKVNYIVKVLIFSDLLIWSAENLVTPIFAVFVVNNIGAPIHVAGIAMAIFLISKSFFEIPVGYLIDRTKSEIDDLFTIIFGSVGLGICYLLMPLVKTSLHLYILEFFMGFSAAVAYPGWSALFTAYVDKSKKAFQWSLYDVLTGLGLALAAGLGGFLVSFCGFHILFIIVGFLMIMGSLLLLIIKDKIKI